MADLTDKTVLVTGAGSGIGKATAALAAASGATVIVADVKGAEETAKEIDGGAEAYTLDITDAARWQEVVDKVIGKHGRLHVPAHVAGITSDTDPLLTRAGPTRPAPSSASTALCTGALGHTNECT